VRWIRFPVVVLGATWFFPISFAAGVFLGTKIISKLDEREALEGQKVHSPFTIVAEPGVNGKPFRRIRLSELPRFEERAGGISYLMSNPSGRISTETSRISYRVVEESPSDQVIEVVEEYDDGDNTILSRYRATHSTVSPISSRMFYFGYMFQAIPYAFGIALFLYVMGRFIRSRVHGTNRDGEDARPLSL